MGFIRKLFTLHRAGSYDVVLSSPTAPPPRDDPDVDQRPGRAPSSSSSLLATGSSGGSRSSLRRLKTPGKSSHRRQVVARDGEVAQPVDGGHGTDDGHHVAVVPTTNDTTSDVAQLVDASPEQPERTRIVIRGAKLTLLRPLKSFALSAKPTTTRPNRTVGGDREDDRPLVSSSGGATSKSVDENDDPGVARPSGDDRTDSAEGSSVDGPPLEDEVDDESGDARGDDDGDGDARPTSTTRRQGRPAHNARRPLPPIPCQNADELAYLRLVRRILQHGVPRDDRTRVGTLALFGEMLTFDLTDNRFPLLTTKRVTFRSVLLELLWFLRGSTNANELSEQRVHIWDANGRRDVLDALGFQDREEGELGPIYGWQWRRFGAPYPLRRENYAHSDRSQTTANYRLRGVDQIASAVRSIRRDPYSRRILVSSWNPADLHLMALPPCHLLFQFFVEPEARRLSGMLYMRSADVGLGLPFNIASYAALLHLTATHCDLVAHQLKIVLGDTHVYSSHVDALRLQIERTPYAFPTLHIRRRDESADLAEYTLADFQLRNYRSHLPLPMPMAV